MSLSIYDETRKHLLRFLKKSVEESYTLNEFENFSVMAYQNKEFESVRLQVVELLMESANANVVLSDANKKRIKYFISELEAKAE